MDILLEWFGYLARWGHVLTAITWIGTSFYFNWLDLSDRKPEVKTLMPNVQGQLHEMHGGSYYYHERYWPTEPPKRLLNHSGPAQLTFLTGLLLIVYIYWLGADVYLLDPSGNSPSLWVSILLSALILFLPYPIYDQVCKRTDNNVVVLVFSAVLILVTGYLALQFFSPRAAFVHVGAMLGTIMALNVHFVIVPNHIKMHTQVRNGELADLAYHKQAKRRSQHNNYYTLPVLFSMLSAHFPLAYGNDYGFLTLFMVMGGGFLLRYARNRKFVTDKTDLGAGLLAILFLAGGIALTYIPATGEVQDMSAFTSDEEKAAFEIVQQRCAVCHSARPTMEGFASAPAGVRFDTVAQMTALKDRIYTQAIAIDIMPPGNLTEMTDDERSRLGQWLISIGAKNLDE
ncbi:MAG: urate hydroxylase PuuD [Rhodobacteraceae bacterium]|nr:urate hydroxylase PuuD [Paracoccaceae bacterium]